MNHTEWMTIKSQATTKGRQDMIRNAERAARMTLRPVDAEEYARRAVEAYQEQEWDGVGTD